MGVCRAVLDLDARRCAAAGLQPARSVQRLALDGADRGAMAHDAQRFAAVDGGLSTGPAVDESRRL